MKISRSCNGCEVPLNLRLMNPYRQVSPYREPYPAPRYNPILKSLNVTAIYYLPLSLAFILAFCLSGVIVRNASISLRNEPLSKLKTCMKACDHHRVCQEFCSSKFQGK